MSIFGKMFDKKVCDICGGDIGLLGNRKLSDGNLCKDCARKLSPWMTDRRQSSVAEIRQHLAYRENNWRILDNVHPSLVLGGNTKVYIDEAAGVFFVSAYSNWRDRNPDVVPFSQVIDVRTEVTEHRTEEYHRDREGKNVPFNPPRYRFSYEFDTSIMVDSPYFNEIRFELTDTRPERRGTPEYRYFEEQAEALRAALMPGNRAVRADLAQALSAAIGQAVASVNTAAAAAPVTNVTPAAVKAAAAAAAATPVTNVTPAAVKAAAEGQWTCACGSVNTGNFCTQCGAKRPEPVKVFRCDKCGWTPEDPTNPPRFCPNCGDPFNEADAR